MMPRTEFSKSVISKNARKLTRFLAKRKQALSPFLIVPHDYPDPDALASAVTLRYIAEKKFGLQARIAYGGVIGRMENRRMVKVLKLPVYRLKAGDFRKYRYTALVDTQPGFENNPFPNNKRATLIIDQHPSLKRPDADLVIVDPTCGATSVILAKALLYLKMEIPTNIATALAYGILSDTLNLFRAPSMEVIETYLYLLPYCDMRHLARIQNPDRSRKFFSTLAKGIQNAMVRRGLIVSHLGNVESPDLVAQVADFLLTYKKISWALVTGRYQERLHASLRGSRPQADAGEILRDVFVSRWDAGGHGAIGGGSLVIGEGVEETIWQQFEDELTDRLVSRLRIPKKSEFYYPFRQKQ